MKSTVDSETAERYGQLLAQTQPRAITTRREYERLLAETERLSGQANLPVEEEQLLDLLTVLVELYEQQHAALPDATPDQMLRFFMDQHKLRQVDLLPVFGTAGAVSNAVSGRRGISKVQAKKLAQLFHTRAEHFI